MSAETRLLEKLQDHLARLATELEEIKNQRDHFHHELIQNRDENAQLRITNAQLSTEKAQWLAERARLQTKVESLELREFDSQQKRSSAAGSVSTVSPSTDSTPVPDQKPRFSGTHDDEVIDLTLDEESQPVGSVSKIPAASGTQFNVRSDSDARVRSQRRIKSEIKAEESIDFSQLIPESADSYIGATGGIFVIDDNDNCITTSAEKMIPKKRERSLSPSDIVLPPTPSSNRSRSATTQENEWYTPVGDDSASNSLPKVEDGAWSDASF
ncbi:hypothetical protein NEOLEDRAFT_158539 [Neolentinus lepideus HHB14362 ss-1]|uniref:Uncharacterized protein n=1 Tax=Neolentinus lepideus HHB14362 ss-1 TaxID=1314782 RepID=A0A165TTB6_9AGAM|nr:hypothetical protein NEOLEDRAFT_158539 [Neolentinus lepideus HHB14362 ss-1]